MMKIWTERNREEAHLLNPAFCCINITLACTGYSDSSGLALPFALAFMILPIVLHKNTRESLPRTVRTSIPAWMYEHAEARIGFHQRLMALKPYTREAISYGLIFGWMGINDLGNIESLISTSMIKRVMKLSYEETKECINSAYFLGKWFSKIALTETTLALWGVRP